MSDASVWGDVIARALEAASATKDLGYGELNDCLPADAPLELLDELFRQLENKGITLVDELREESSRRAPRPGSAPPTSGVTRELVAGSTGERPSDVGSVAREDEPSEDMPGLTADEQMELLANPAKQYVGAVKLQGRLDEGAEQDLARAILDGDEQARETLIAAYMPLVVTLARRFRRSGVPFMELVLAGNEGLVEAVAHHRWASEERFGRTARWWIRHRLSRCVAENWQGQRLPPRVARRLKRLAKLSAKYRGRRGREPSAAFLARALRLPLDEVFLLQGLFSSPLSLNAPMAGDAEAGTLADRLADAAAPEGQSELERRELRKRLDNMLGELDLVERRVLVLRFGLEDSVSRSADEVARLTGLSKSEVLDYERRGMERLRQYPLG